MVPTPILLGQIFQETDYEMEIYAQDVKLERAFRRWRKQDCAAGKAKLQYRCNCEPQPIQWDFLSSWNDPLKTSRFRQGWSLKRGIIWGCSPALKAIPRGIFRYELWAANTPGSWRNGYLSLNKNTWLVHRSITIPFIWLHSFTADLALLASVPSVLCPLAKLSKLVPEETCSVLWNVHLNPHFSYTFPAPDLKSPISPEPWLLLVIFRGHNLGDNGAHY